MYDFLKKISILIVVSFNLISYGAEVERSKGIDLISQLFNLEASLDFYKSIGFVSPLDAIFMDYEVNEAIVAKNQGSFPLITIGQKAYNIPAGPDQLETLVNIVQLKVMPQGGSCVIPTSDPIIDPVTRKEAEMPSSGLNLTPELLKSLSPLIEKRGKDLERVFSEEQIGSAFGATCSQNSFENGLIVLFLLNVYDSLVNVGGALSLDDFIDLSNDLANPTNRSMLFFQKLADAVRVYKENRGEGFKSGSGLSAEALRYIVSRDLEAIVEDVFKRKYGQFDRSSLSSIVNQDIRLLRETAGHWDLLLKDKKGVGRLVDYDFSRIKMPENMQEAKQSFYLDSNKKIPLDFSVLQILRTDHNLDTSQFLDTIYRFRKEASFRHVFNISFYLPFDRKQGSSVEESYENPNHAMGVVIDKKIVGDKIHASIFVLESNNIVEVYQKKIITDLVDVIFNTTSYPLSDSVIEHLENRNKAYKSFPLKEFDTEGKNIPGPNMVTLISEYKNIVNDSVDLSESLILRALWFLDEILYLSKKNHISLDDLRSIGLDWRSEKNKLEEIRANNEARKEGELEAKMNHEIISNLQRIGEIRGVLLYHDNKNRIDNFLSMIGYLKRFKELFQKYKEKYEDRSLADRISLDKVLNDFEVLSKKVFVKLIDQYKKDKRLFQQEKLSKSNLKKFYDDMILSIDESVGLIAKGSRKELLSDFDFDQEKKFIEGL